MLFENNSQLDYSNEVTEKTKFEKMSLAINSKQFYLSLCNKLNLEKEVEVLTPYIETYMYSNSKIKIQLKLKTYTGKEITASKRTINNSKTFLDLNREKNKLELMFGTKKASQLTGFIDSVFKLKRNDFIFDCESLDLDEMFIHIVYPKELLDIEIDFIKAT